VDNFLFFLFFFSLFFLLFFFLIFILLFFFFVFLLFLLLFFLFFFLLLFFLPLLFLLLLLLLHWHYSPLRALACRTMSFHFAYLPPTLSIFSLPALEDLFLLPLCILSWVFPFFSSLIVLE
jgi:hypothetical protein